MGLGADNLDKLWAVAKIKRQGKVRWELKGLFLNQYTVIRGNLFSQEKSIGIFLFYA